MRDFREAQASCVSGHQHRPQLKAADCVEKPDNFILAQHHREFFGLAWERDVGDGPIAPQGMAIEKPEGADCLVEVTPGDVPFLHQIYLVLTNLFRPQQFGRLAEMPGELSDLSDVALDGPRGTVADLQIVDHALTKSSHEKLLSKRRMFDWSQTLSPRRELLHNLLLELVAIRVAGELGDEMRCVCGCHD